MKRDSRLSNVLHALLHMAEMDGPATSDSLAQAMQTNPVVVRRLMAGLRYAGFVSSAKGHGGGWVLSCPLADITLRDIHEALGAPTLLAVGNRVESPGCVVEQAVNEALSDAFEAAEQVLLTRLGEVTLAQLSAQFHERMVARGHAHKDFAHEHL
ncbi:Rrf2 family transcriptional regulator [Acidovorax sp. Root267]|uniref:Rrf2 family transcriptional regulator n=1 Tax=Acidovorax sp. Root267 TaxID=1736505 RepID=UPI00070CAEB6|nr:Rrf2 family transcriptional regulator [Acidovorax sp. Root267]KRD13881.1 Rrf2 family transcriptional regulator [Acidovorax sp. Root267]